jgi:hypothetical protein
MMNWQVTRGLGMLNWSYDDGVGKGNGRDERHEMSTVWHGGEPLPVLLIQVLVPI